MRITASTVQRCGALLLVLSGLGLSTCSKAPCGAVTEDQARQVSVYVWLPPDVTVQLTTTGACTPAEPDVVCQQPLRCPNWFIRLTGGVGESCLITAAFGATATLAARQASQSVCLCEGCGGFEPTDLSF